MASRKERAAVASSPEVEVAATELLAKGNAVDAVVAGVFAACAIAPTVLLGPVQILMGGGGTGLHALDGRVRQPGIGAPRPRGFTESEEIPDAARVGTPWLPATLAVALASAGSASFAQVLAPAIMLAKGSGRADILKKIASHGPRAIEERPLSAELLNVAGRPSGGLLTTDDLSSPRPELLPASPARRGDRIILSVPWANREDGAPAPPAPEVDIASTRAVAAVDRHGTFAVACWEEAPEGIWLGDLGIKAPLSAEPVRRGKTRVRPGHPRPSAAPLALVAREHPEIALAAFGARDAYDVIAGALASLVRDDRIEAHGEARLVAVSHVGGMASVL